MHPLQVLNLAILPHFHDSLAVQLMKVMTFATRSGFLSLEFTDTPFSFSQVTRVMVFTLESCKEHANKKQL